MATPQGSQMSSRYTAPRLCPRHDLRTGRLVGARLEGPYLSSPAQAQAALQIGQAAWTAQGAPGPLSLSLSERLSMPNQASALDQAARAAGLTPSQLTFEIEERALIARSLPLAQELRALGWRIALRADPQCPLPFGAQARSLYAEVVMTAETAPSPFIAIDALDRDHLGRRILAAREARLTLTVEAVQTAEAARLWLNAGFDHAEGQFSDALPVLTPQSDIATLDRSPVALSFSSR